MTAALAESDTEIVVDGEMYTEVLRRLHQVRAPQTYFEIGTLHGDTLRLSQCRSVAVDPIFQLTDPTAFDRSRITLREMTSDDYFAGYNPQDDLGGPIDLAFLDGMHEFPYVLRDFNNTEKACKPGSIIALHDCIPRDYFMTRPHRDVGVIQKPSRYPGYWTGDVWKMVPVLRKYRPGLNLRCLDALPTGLAICTNLDPASRVLADNYDAIISEWGALELDDFGMRELFAIARIDSTANWWKQVGPAPSLGRRLKQALGLSA